MCANRLEANLPQNFRKILEHSGKLPESVLQKKKKKTFCASFFLKHVEFVTSLGWKYFVIFLNIIKPVRSEEMTAK